MPTGAEIDETSNILADQVLQRRDEGDIVLAGASLAGLNMRLRPMVGHEDLSDLLAGLTLELRQPGTVDLTSLRELLLDHVEQHLANETPRDRLRAVPPAE